jgi:hypothetical protein
MLTMLEALVEGGFDRPAIATVDSVEVDPRLSVSETRKDGVVRLVVVGSVGATYDWFHESYLARWPRTYGTMARRTGDDMVVISRFESVDS